jgi:hypothetical protein
MFTTGVKRSISILAFLTVSVFLSSCGSTDPQEKIANITERLCKTMKIIGYNFDDSAIQSLDESVGDQLMRDIDELRKLAPSVLNRPLEELCSQE